VDVVVCERRVPSPYDTRVLRSQGIVPEACKIIVVKSWVHFRGSFEPIASRIIEVDTPGLTTAEFNRFAYRNVPRPLWPLD
jgi:microcystin degradation protein MlrC